MAGKRIAIIGAGPVGLEAALHGVQHGHDVTVYERGLVGEHVRQWGHIRLFSHFAFNRSDLGASKLREAGIDLPHDDDYLTGADYVARYLSPLAKRVLPEGTIREDCDVLRIGRHRLLKSDMIGGPRETQPFRMLVAHHGVESVESADVVLDCSGTWRQANALGNGGIPAPGEREAADTIRYRLDDVLGSDRSRYEDRRVMLVGAGHSAVTALDHLLQLDGTTVVWVRRETGAEPYTVHRIAAGDAPRVEVRSGTVVDRVDGGRITLDGPGGRETVAVDAVLALVGYRPDRELYAELQVHECWATMGPIKLAATLIGGGDADCLAQTSAGAETLRSPEPGFFVLGAKSYGKNVNFLIRVGLEQVREVFTLIESG
jgi:hypothetical protein